MASPTLTQSLLGLVDATAGDYKTINADSNVWTINRIIKETEGALYIVGEEAGDAILYLSADIATDNNDQWRLRVVDGGDLTIETFQSGAWVAVRTFSNTGEVTNPSQPAFYVKLTSDLTNIAVGSAVTVPWSDEITDQGSNFASNVFTAPVSGQYFLTTTLVMETIDQASTSYTLEIATSNRSYFTGIDPRQFAADVGSWSLHLTVLADMDANDTAAVKITQASGTQQTDINNLSGFQGFLAA